VNSSSGKEQCRRLFSLVLGGIGKKIQNMGLPFKNAESVKEGCEIISYSGLRVNSNLVLFNAIISSRRQP
jgi:hypothetical protein